MASAVASGLPLVAPSLQLPKSQHRQLSTKGTVHGAVNCLVQKSNLGQPFPKTSIQRRARRSLSRKAAIDHDKIYKLNVAAGAESNASSEGGDSENGSSLRQSELKRRELLWAATGSFSYLSSSGLAQSAPVPPSDMDIKNCKLVDLATPGQTENCCLPDASGLKPIQFKFEDLPMRTRKPAHTLFNDANYVSKYNEAYRLMKALPDTDPRSFKNQWHVHCAFCNGAYLEPGNSSNQPIQYHFSWTFLPWHRMYLYFHERILGELIGDPSFALPFWNWDNQRPEGGNQMPRIFTDDLGSKNDVLRTAIRDPNHYPPAYVDLGEVGTDDHEVLIRSNLSIVHSAVVSKASAALFLGGSYSANQAQNSNSPGSCETEVHNTVHSWTGMSGNPQYPDNEDMGVFIYAARDPIFYSHHSNVDRLWAVWKTLPADQSTRGGRRRRWESRKPDFMNTKFAFYDHKKQLVHVKIRDSLNTAKLSYKYQEMPSDSDWINFEARPSGRPKPSPGDILPFAKSITILDPKASTSFVLFRRAPTDDETKDHEDEQLTPEDLEETLLIKGVKVPARGFMAYRVFINRPDANKNTPLDIYEFAGLITHVPHSGKKGGHDHSRGLDFRISIGTAMSKLKLPVGELVCVTFVPVFQKEAVKFEGVESEWR